jgi:hypothetical protein
MMDENRFWTWKGCVGFAGVVAAFVGVFSATMFAIAGQIAGLGRMAEVLIVRMNAREADLILTNLKAMMEA